MSVKCIVVDASPGREVNPPFKEGDIVHICEPDRKACSFLILMGKNPEIYCLVLEYPTHEGYEIYWDKSRFIPLSDIDETEFERPYMSSLVTVKKEYFVYIHPPFIS